MEMLDIVDENGSPTGQTVERSIAHEKGIRHRTSHVWLARMHNGKCQILLQKRCATKDSFPGCYDISSAGHIPAGVDYIPSALRELYEELGIKASEEELMPCGRRYIHYERTFYGKPFIDSQVTNVYLLWRDLEPEKFNLQKSELDSVMWMELEECIKSVDEGSIPNCIMPEELQMVKKRLMKELAEK
jgi:isopentenyldiphosphate isomerase